MNIRCGQSVTIKNQITKSKSQNRKSRIKAKTKVTIPVNQLTIRHHELHQCDKCQLITLNIPIIRFLIRSQFAGL